MPTSSSFSTDNQYIKYRIIVTESNISIPNNTSSVNAKVDAWRTNTGYTTYGTGTCYCTINGTKYSQSIGTSQKITHNSHTVLFNRTVSVRHGADGKKTIGVSAYIKHQKFNSSSHGFNVKLADIPRQANIVTAEPFTDEGTPSFTYNNLAGDIVESIRAGITLDAGILDNPIIAYRDVNRDEASFTFELTNEEREALRQATPNRAVTSAYYVLESVIANVTYYSVVGVNLTIVNAEPIITGARYEDVNPTTRAITNPDFTQIIQGYSSINFYIDTLTAQKYATLRAITVKCFRSTITKYYNNPVTSDSNLDINLGTIDSSSDIVAEVTLEDSRGYKTTVNLPITMLAWALPNAIITCARKNNFYSETDINVNGNYSSLDNKNQLSLSFRYKERGSSAWSNYITLTDEVTYTAYLDNTKEFDIQVLVADLIGSVTYNLTLDKGVPIVLFDRLKKSIGVNKIPEVNNGIDAEGDIKTEGNLEAGGNISGTKLFVDNISVSDISDQFTITKTSGNWSVKEIKAVKSGNIVQIRIAFGGNGSSVSAGSNGFAGTMTAGKLPLISVKLIAYYNNAPLFLNIDPDGAMTARVTAVSVTVTTTGTLNMTGTYITSD